MQLDREFVKKLLLEGNYVDESDMKKAEEYAKTHRSDYLQYLFSEGLTTQDIIGQAVAEYLGVPYSDLNSNQPPKEQVLKIPEEAARRLRAVLFRDEPSRAVIASDNPSRAGLKDELAVLFPGKEIAVTFSLPEDLDQSFVSYQKTLETRFSKIIEGKKRIAPDILDEIFADAIAFRASDIHFEIQSGEAVIRFRIDGVLQDAGHLPKEFYENILNRIKVQSGIRIDEHFAAQDGSMRFQKEGLGVDIRTSIVPTVEGEKAVLRVLGSYVQGLTLSELGLSSDFQVKLEEIAAKPFGMIVVTGPTGSGKTTTLYALLKLLNQSDVNITTIEDPVEYKMSGINQIQVNPYSDLTFAKGLRSVVRQDPDIILVGEIRDEETAEIAVNAALTGHLLLSTFHANDSATAIPRFLDMGVEPFLLSSTLELVIAQRLARKLCEHCRYSITLPLSEVLKRKKGLETYFKEKEETLYVGKGCSSCGNTGYRGRTAIFEFIVATPEVKELILKNPSTQDIWKLAATQGSKTLFEDGVEKVKNGVTTLDELLRVAEPPPLPPAKAVKAKRSKNSEE